MRIVGGRRARSIRQSGHPRCPDLCGMCEHVTGACRLRTKALHSPTAKCSAPTRRGGTMKPAYRDLYFGMSDARNEVTEDEASFVKSYVDLNDASQALINGRKFMVLGPKGTGKSALAWYLQATERDGSHLVLVRDATALPLAEVPRVQTGQAPGPERTVVAWKFILLCNYLELLLRDQGCSVQGNNEVLRVARLLRDFGFMGDASGHALLRAANTTITIPIPKLGPIYKRESRPTLNIYNLIPYLETWVSEAASM